MTPQDAPRPDDPTSAARPLVRRSLADGPPPDPPRPLRRDAAGEERSFLVEETRWVATRAGRGTTGTGAYGLGLVEAIHFRRPERTEAPEREALLPAGRFDGLYEEELRALLAESRAIVRP